MNMESLNELFEDGTRKGDLKKMEIILAAIDCLATIGFEKTTFEAIAKRIGTRRAHVAYHYKDKNDIFMAMIKYIVTNYQEISLAHIKDSREGEQTLLHYVEGPFVWAQKNPKQLSVMLLFYYLCSFRDEYLNLNNQIRIAGVERMQFILTNQFSPAYKVEDAKFLSKQIQNLISGNLIDAYTTKNKSVKQAMKDTKNAVKRLLIRV